MKRPSSTATVSVREVSVVKGERSALMSVRVFKMQKYVNFVTGEFRANIQVVVSWVLYGALDADAGHEVSSEKSTLIARTTRIFAAQCAARPLTAQGRIAGGPVRSTLANRRAHSPASPFDEMPSLPGRRLIRRSHDKRPPVRFLRSSFVMRQKSMVTENCDRCDDGNNHILRDDKMQDDLSS
jgi:hypothetical protein